MWMGFGCYPHAEFLIDGFGLSDGIQQFVHEVKPCKQKGCDSSLFKVVHHLKKKYFSGKCVLISLPKWQFCSNAHPPFAMKFETNLRAWTSCPCPMEIARQSMKVEGNIYNSPHIFVKNNIHQLLSDNILQKLLPMPRFLASPSIWFVGSDPILRKQMRGVRGSLSPHVASRSNSTGSA